MVFFRFSVVVAGWLVWWYGCSCSGLGMGMGMCLFRFGCDDVVVLIFFLMGLCEWWNGRWVYCFGFVVDGVCRLWCGGGAIGLFG